MNYYGPLQRKDTKRWDYTRTNDGDACPVGYCAGWKDKETLIEQLGEEAGNQLHAEREPYQNNFHTNGHVSAEDACECYKQFLLDFCLRLDKSFTDAQKKCEACGAWTQKFAEVKMRLFVLCDEHRNRQEIEKRLSIGTSISSW